MVSSLPWPRHCRNPQPAGHRAGDDTGVGPPGDAVQRGGRVTLGQAEGVAGLLFLTPAAPAPRDSDGADFFPAVANRGAARGIPAAGRVTRGRDDLARTGELRGVSTGASTGPWPTTAAPAPSRDANG